MINDQERAEGILADALWWFRGFAASAKGANARTAAELAENLRETRIWLQRVSTGHQRLLGNNERAFGVALTGYEFEVLVDGLRSEPGSTDHEEALAYAKRIADDLRQEQKRFVARLGPEVPF